MALVLRRHKVMCAPGARFKHFTRLLQREDRLYNLRSHDFPSLDSTSFESVHSSAQFQTISPSDHSQRPPTVNSELSIQQTTTLPLQVSGFANLSKILPCFGPSFHFLSLNFKKCAVVLCSLMYFYCLWI